MRVKIRLDTMKSVVEFNKVCERITERVLLTDGNDFQVSAHSLLGAIASMEWENIYCTCERDISGKILPWIV